MGLQYHRRAKRARRHFAPRPRARLLSRGSFSSDTGSQLGQENSHEPAFTRVGGETRLLELARSQKEPYQLVDAHEREDPRCYSEAVPRAGKGHAEALHPLYARPGRNFLPHAADQKQTSPLITISIFTLFTLCAKPQAHKQSAKLSASKTSSRNWRPWLVVQKPAWQMSVSPIT